MAYTPFEYTSVNGDGDLGQSTNSTFSLDAGQSESLSLPSSSYVTEANMLKDGFDLVLETSDGSVTVENYFAQEPPPLLVTPDGKTLTPDLVDSFAHSPQEYANAGMNANDASPVGAVQEITGEAHVIRTDGTVETIGVGTHMFQGDIVETEEDGAVNIMFIDETTFAISEDARLAIDEYVFDPATQSGTTNFSVLKGVFVFTSGLIGREDPDDVMIDTPSGSIGIRGTIIAGNVDSGEITVIEGAIVLHDFNGNTLTLSNQYETARFDTSSQSIEYIGELGAEDVAENFSSVSNVSGDLFSSIEDSAAESQEAHSEEATQTTSENEAEAENTEGKELPKPEPEKQEATEEQPEQTAAESEETEKPLPEEKKAEDTNEPAPEEDTVITSDEITGSSVEDMDSSSSNDTEPPKPPPAEENTNSSSSEPASAEPALAENNDTSETPSFYITVNTIKAGENTFGADVARVTGHITESTNLKLLGLSANYYDIVRENDNTFLVKLKPGVELEAENQHPLKIEATNGLGTISITENVDLNIAYVNDPIEEIFSVVDSYAFSGTDGSSTVYDMSTMFYDPEGRINSYSVSASLDAHANVNDVSWDNNTGLLTVDLDGSGVTTDSVSFTITAYASDGSSLTSSPITYDFYATTNQTGAPLNLFTTNAQVNTTSTQINIIADSVRVFADSNAADNNVYVGNNNAYVKAGKGDDTFDIQDGDYTLFGGDGNDTFEVDGASTGVGFIYGGEGNDNIAFDSTPLGGLSSAAPATTIIDGGGGYDVFVVNEGGSIDFGSINDDVIRNFEELLIDQGAPQTNSVLLSYDDVIALTDADNKLAINGDNLDSVNFNNTEGTTFLFGGVVNQAGEDYNAYSDGTITLLIDTDINAGNVTGIV